ncbi:DUF4402 domain-containing protein [Qipengyuania sp. NPDC077563]|uniref:DUF4402 domain-containing protein n=1 Tax=Qipengyuania sp. NPDC077563 TaxID=3364497 RepID=UPI00384C63F8
MRSVVHFSLCALAILGLAIPSVTLAQPRSGDLRLRTDGELKFGTFMVFGSGARSVSASGAVVDQSIVALEGTKARPGQFTVEYERKGANTRALTVTIELVISAPAQIRQGGVNARLSQFETDLPGYSRISNGQSVRVELPNCRSKTCTRSFNIGARLDVTRNYGGADIAIPIDLDGRVVSVDWS